MLYVVALPIAAVSLVTLMVTIGRHWKEIRLLDPDSIKEERARQKRDELISQRFERVRANAMVPLKALMNRAALSGKKTFHAAYVKLVQLDRFYKQAKAPFAAMAPSHAERLKTLLDEARSFARDEKWGDAERRYLEILGVDKRNVQAYKGLATLYLKQRLYPQAKETFEFLVKIKKADDVCYAGMGQIAEAQGDAVLAEQWFQKAVHAHPRLAQRHAELAEFYLSHQEPEKAWSSAVKATELEPSSAKYLENSIEAALRTNRREEARRRYDSLRLVTDDRTKLQLFKKRIDELGL